jgi:acetate kinase
MNDSITVLNAGSSSFKFSLFAQGAEGAAVVARGQAEGLYTSPRFVAKNQAGAEIDEKAWREGVSLGHRGALDYLVAFLRQHLTSYRLVAVGHRLVHGGLEYTKPVRIGASVVAGLAKYISLSALHQPNNPVPSVSYPTCCRSACAH